MYEDSEEYEDEGTYAPVRTKTRERRKDRAPRREEQATADQQKTQHTAQRAPALSTQHSRGPSRAVREGRESFKCVHCRAFIGPTISGGKHRNHCPLCLYSRHVDGKRPGDRASDCNAKMAPIGRFTRPNGEPMVVHRCLGCGFERNNRLAADDNMLLFEELPLVSPQREEEVLSAE